MDETPECTQCGGSHAFLGNLGRNAWFRCAQCGWTECWPTEDQTVIDAANDDNLSAAGEGA